ncbi:MAG: hypothetical protein HYY06_15050 [Deltaproteobacteria bacterium]|nr:hypothetical protein [Deltaproteobacteria bacterium]
MGLDRKSLSRMLLGLLCASFGCVGADDTSDGSGGGGGGKADGFDGELPEGISRELVDAATANLARVSAEIDDHHLANYRLTGDIAQQFVTAVIIEYYAEPDLLERRLETLASMVFFSAPEVETDAALGRLTPFHGMNDAAFEALMSNEDTVFNHHMNQNGGSPNGVRPFSVCETKFLVSIAKGEKAGSDFAGADRITSYDAYARAYQEFAQTCPPEDLAEWYNFRGLGGLRPSWLESNVSDRFLRRMVSECRSPSEDWAADCQEWNLDRLAYRDKKNTELALREVFYDPSPSLTVAGTTLSLEQFLLDPSNEGALVEDRNGDGIGEWLASGDLQVAEGARLTIPSGATFRLQAEATITLDSAATVQTGGGSTELASGTVVHVAAGGSLALASKITRSAGSADPIGIDAGTKVKIPGGAQIRLEDGSSASVPWGSGSSSGITGRLGSTISIPVDTSATLNLSIDSPMSGPLAGQQFAGELHVRLALADGGGGSITATIAARDVQAYDQVDPAWDPSYLGRSDLGLQTIFADGSGCTGQSPSPDSCPLLRRFYSLIDRHENFYQTYSSLKPASASVSQQPSPLVACSITLRASHAWDTAGTPDGGTAGFIYLMRIPFAQILAGDTRSIDTLSLLGGQPGPRVLTVQELYENGAQLDMSKVWLDIATLSHNQYSSEHEVSKFGSVPAEQIEGILVIRRPAAMP